MRALLVAALGLAGCFKAPSGYACNSTTECVRNGQPGLCQPQGFCSFDDPSCASGQRFGEHAGTYSNQCVGSEIVDAAVDTALPDPDAPPDAATDAPPQYPEFVAEAHADTSNTATLTYALTIPSGTKRLLLVSVQLGTSCNNAAPPTASVTYNTAALTRITNVTGTPCGGNTRSEHWILANPDTGTHDVVVTLQQATGYSFHSGALAFTGVNQSTPVRAFQSASGDGNNSSVTVASAANDLVVCTVGQGDSVMNPGATQMLRFRNNSSSGDTMDNSAASTAPGAAMVTMTWTFGQNDEWQTIASSLQP